MKGRGFRGLFVADGASRHGSSPGEDGTTIAHHYMPDNHKNCLLIVGKHYFYSSLKLRELGGTTRSRIGPRGLTEMSGAAGRVQAGVWCQGTHLPALTGRQPALRSRLPTAKAGSPRPSVWYCGLLPEPKVGTPCPLSKVRNRLRSKDLWHRTSPRMGDTRAYRFSVVRRFGRGR